MKVNELEQIKTIISDQILQMSAYISLAFTLIYFIISGLSFWYFMIRKREENKEIKIQKSFPAKLILKKEISYSIISMFIFFLAILLTVYLYFKGKTAIYTELSVFGPTYAIISFFLFMFSYDLFFYLIHRLLHLKAFRSVHGIHHHSVNPTPFSSFSLHPVECSLIALGFPLLIVFIPIHPFVLGLNILHFILVNVMGHSGYEFHPQWFKKTWLGRITNYPTYHNEHHQYGSKSFGLFTIVWDKAFGTMAESSEESCIKYQTIHKPK